MFDVSCPIPGRATRTRLELENPGTDICQPRNSMRAEKRLMMTEIRGQINFVEPSGKALSQ